MRATRWTRSGCAAQKPSTRRPAGARSRRVALAQPCVTQLTERQLGHARASGRAFRLRLRSHLSYRSTREQSACFQRVLRAFLPVTLYQRPGRSSRRARRQACRDQAARLTRRNAADQTAAALAPEPAAAQRRGHPSSAARPERALKPRSAARSGAARNTCRSSTGRSTSTGRPISAAPPRSAPRPTHDQTSMRTFCACQRFRR